MAVAISIRPAQPTIEEGRFFAHFSNQASHGQVRTLFGPQYERILSEAYVSRGHDMSYETVNFAKRGEDIVGMASGYSAEQHRSSSLRPTIRAAGIRMLRLLPIGFLGGRFFSFINEVPDGDFYLAALAVDESVRRSGVGSLLLDEVESRALKEGCHRLALDVAVDNPNARRLYERRGMSVEAESPPIMFMPDKRVYRMAKALA